MFNYETCQQTSSSVRLVTTASIILRGLLTLDTVSLPKEPANWTVDKRMSIFNRDLQYCMWSHTLHIIFWGNSLSFTWSVGVFNLGDLWSDEFGGMFLLAAVSLSFLTFFHLFIVVLYAQTHAHTHARTHTEPRAHTHTHTHTHRLIQVRETGVYVSTF